LLTHVQDLAVRDGYLCGPPGLMTAARESFRRAGLPAGQLHEERFDL
jgi:ferredoxin-NADP reductase